MVCVCVCVCVRAHSSTNGVYVCVCAHALEHQWCVCVCVCVRTHSSVDGVRSCTRLMSVDGVCTRSGAVRRPTMVKQGRRYDFTPDGVRARFPTTDTQRKRAMALARKMEQARAVFERRLAHDRAELAALETLLADAPDLHLEHIRGGFSFHFALLEYHQRVPGRHHVRPVCHIVRMEVPACSTKTGLPLIRGRVPYQLGSLVVEYKRLDDERGALFVSRVNTLPGVPSVDALCEFVARVLTPNALALHCDPETLECTDAAVFEALVDVAHTRESLDEWNARPTGE